MAERAAVSRVSIVGCGVVGASWAVVFARAGFQVKVYDASAAAVQEALAFAKRALDNLHALDGGASVGRRAGESVADILARMTPVRSLAEAVADADYVQESVPERLDVKLAVYEELDSLVPAAAVIGSSTSGFPASAYSEGLRSRERCLVVHPVNPPHLVPLVELVPSPWTRPGIVEAIHQLMVSIGQSPIGLKREINGFVLNRLQSAVLGEAFRLVEDGVCSVEDVDKAMTDGLGLRWFFMGPFETIDLNAAHGLSEYCRNLGPMYYNLAQEQADARPWGPALIEKVERQRRALTPEAALPERRAWRDRCLATLVAMRSRLTARTDAM